MRPLLPGFAWVVVGMCLGVSGCNGGAPFGSASKSVPVSAPVTNPVTIPVTSPSMQAAPVSVVISDPAACKGPNGPLSHVYVSIADVKASPDANAPANDPSFVDLTPNLAHAPMQIDLMGQAASNCFLAALGVGEQVAVGNYQQVRIVLAADSAAATVANNACGASYANCVVEATSSLYDLQLSAETTDGILVSSSQMANGGLLVNAGDSPYIDLNFDICSSIVPVPGGGYQLKPVVHAGVVAASGGSISGNVVSSATGQALNGGQVVVALEQKDPASGTDRVLMRTMAASDGSFILCPVPEGTYDVVAVGVDGSSTAYSAGVEMGIQSGQLAGKIPLVPGSAPGLLEGMVTTENGGRPAAGVSVAIETDALEQLPDGATITVPLLPADNPYNAAMLTTNGSGCPQGVDCATFALSLPATSPNIVTCSEQTAVFTQQSAPPSYTAETFAEIPESGGVADCAANSMRAMASSQGGLLVLNPSQSTTAASESFTQCN